jgi:hypothetical protein
MGPPEGETAGFSAASTCARESAVRNDDTRGDA